MITKHFFIRFIFLILCLIPFGMMMFLGKPERLQGILFDIENFYGLKDFSLHLFIFGSVLLALEAIWLLIKKNKNKFLSNVLLLVIFLPLAFYFSSQDIFYKAEKVTPTQVNNSTLILSTEGSVYNFNLDNYQLAWKYNSPLDTSGNRNSFVIDGQNIFMPFESGGLKKLDINTGKILWQQQIYGKNSSGMDFVNNDIDVEGLTPLFMSKPLIDNQNIVIASHGQPNTTQPFLYSFDLNNGKINWKKRLSTHFNYFSPVKYKGSKFNYYFVNSAVYLEKYGANTGSNISYGMYLTDNPNDRNRFKDPLYNQMQTDGKSLFIGDEKGRFYSLPLNENANVLNQDINNSNNTFIKNPSVFNWVYSDEDFRFINNGKTFLADQILYAEVKNSAANQSKLFAINTINGKLKWQKIISGRIENWFLIENKIVGYTSDKIFRLDASGEDFVEYDIQSKPLSNIEQIDSSNIIYLSKKGIEIYDFSKKLSQLVVEKNFNENQHDNVQIKYISK